MEKTSLELFCERAAKIYQDLCMLNWPINVHLPLKEPTVHHFLINFTDVPYGLSVSGNFDFRSERLCETGLISEDGRLIYDDSIGYSDVITFDNIAELVLEIERMAFIASTDS